MPEWTSQALAEWAHHDRVRFFNTLLGVRPAHLVGTASEECLPNLAVFNSACHISASPPRIGILSRSPTVRRDTLENIRSTGAWTLNAITQAMLPAAHRTAEKCPPSESEFDRVGLEPEWRPGFPAPAVQESPLQIGLRLVEDIPIPSADLRLLVGAVEWVQLPEHGLAQDRSLLPDRLGLLGSVGLDAYASPQEVARFEHRSRSS